MVGYLHHSHWQTLHTRAIPHLFPGSHLTSMSLGLSENMATQRGITETIYHSEYCLFFLYLRIIVSKHKHNWKKYIFIKIGCTCVEQSRVHIVVVIYVFLKHL